MILVLPNVTMEEIKCEGKKKRFTKCDKSTITCDVGTI